MCQLSGDISYNNNPPNVLNNSHQSSENAKNLQYCRDSLLWQGNVGKECLCYSDWCNSSRTISFTSSLYLFLLIPFYVLIY